MFYRYLSLTPLGLLNVLNYIAVCYRFCYVLRVFCLSVAFC